MSLIRYFKIVLFTFLILGLSIQDAQAQKKKKKKDKVQTALIAARSYMGTPYKYGGNTKNGIDCSGLIYQSYKSAGISLPRTAKSQSKIGKSKSWEEIKPGDLVFFKFKEDGEKWWHSGMITHVSKNQIKFIHASTSKGVVESNLLSDYYKSNVKRFQRVVK